MRRNILAGIAIIAVLIGVIGHSEAAQFTVEFTGIVDRVDVELSDGTVILGDQVEGSFTYDDGVADSDPSSEIASYLGAVTGFHVAIGPSFSATADGNLRVWNNASSVNDGFFADSEDESAVSINGRPLSHYQVALATFYFSLWDDDGVPSPEELEAAFAALIAADANGDVNWMRFNCGGVNCLIAWDLTSFTVTGATPAEAVKDLVEDVLTLNIDSGLTSSFDAKLDTALGALDDLNDKNDVAAINSLYAFVNEVEAQRGKSISEEDADALVAAALAIIASLEEM